MVCEVRVMHRRQIDATLILEGKDDVLITPEEAKILAKKIQGSIFQLLDGVAHCIHIENPKLFTGIVLEFLSTH